MTQTYHDEVSDDVSWPGDGRSTAAGVGEGLVSYGGARSMDGGSDGERKEGGVDGFREEDETVRDGLEHIQEHGARLCKNVQFRACT